MLIIIIIYQRLAETINEIARISFGVLSTVAIESAKELRRAAVYV